MVHVLIVDDEEEMRDLISMYLQNSGYRTSEAEGYKQLQDEFLKDEKDEPDLGDLFQ